MGMRFASVVTVLAGCLSAADVRGAAVTEMSLEDIVQAIVDSEQEVRSLSVTNRMQVVQQYFPGQPDVEVRLDVVESIILDADGRTRVEIDGQGFRHTTDGEPEVYPQQVLGVYDGQQMRQTSGLDRFTQGLVTSSRSDLAMRLDPRHVTTHYFYKPVSGLLKKSGVLVGEVDWDGRTVMRLETTPSGTDDKRRYVFLIDPGYNFAIVKRAVEIQFSGHERWMEYTRIVGSEYEEVHPGVWLPGHAVHESLDPTRENAADGTDPALAWRWDVVMEDWQVNPELTEALFRLDFSPGVYVNDQVTGRSFQVAGISDELIRHQAQVGDEWRESQQGYPFGLSRRQMFVGLNAIVMVALLGFIGFRRMRSR